MLGLINKILANDKMRYLIAGGCTTLINIATFYILRTFTDISRNLSNAIAIFMAIVFAYFANKFFVFKSETKNASSFLGEATAFAGGRLIAMAIEILGVAILCDSFRMNEFLSKIFVQFIVVVINYMFSKIFVFGIERRTFKEHIRKFYYLYIPFLLVFTIMIAICIAEKIAPFGPNSLTIVDSLHQYIPFFSEYQDKLKGEGSLFYTWNVGMGSNFVSLSAYYLSSPFNYLILLFKKKNLVACICLIMILKIALSSVTMAYFLKHKGVRTYSKERERKVEIYNIPIIALSVCYALSNYVIGYYWNVMWMDCIMMLPLVILGFERLMKKNDPRLYTISLFYCLYCNYYIGFIICLFLVLWFFVYNHKRIKAFFLNGIKFAICSLIAGGMSAFLLIPAYLGIMSTASANAKMPGWTWYGNIFEMFKQMLFGTESITTQTFDGGVNLYCGTLAIFLVFVYIFTDRIKLGDKLRMLSLLAILMVSFNSEKLNFIWHGMHNQYGIPNRFSILFIFVLIVIAFETIKRIKRTDLLTVILSGFLSIFLVKMCKTETVDGITNLTLIGSLCILGVLIIVTLLLSLKKIKRPVFLIIISGITIAEVCSMGIINFMNNGYAAYERYYETTPKVTAAYSEVEDMATEVGAGFYRAELMDSTVLNEVTWHNMPSVATFCSTVLGDMVHTMGRLGFYTGANEFLYLGATPFTNSIFNVRYLLEREGDYNNFTFDYSKTVSDVHIYENRYPLSIAFAVSDNVKNWDVDATSRPFEAQNTLINHMAASEYIFDYETPYIDVYSEDCDVSIIGNTVDYTPYNAGEATIRLLFTTEKAGDYYVNCRGNGITKIKVIVDGVELSYDRYQLQIFRIGNLEKGQQVELQYYYKSRTTTKETASLYIATFKENAFATAHDRLDNNLVNVEEYDDGYFRGSFDINEDQTLFTSVPYDKGWTVKIDGKKVDYYKLAGSFIGVDAEPGKHEIEMTYVPKGLYLGIIISFISAALLALLYGFSKKMK